MIRRVAWAVVLCSLALNQTFAGGLTIKATPKAGGARKGGNITAGKNIQKEERDMYYAFDIRSMAPAPQADLRVEWVVLVKTMKGKLRTATEGHEVVSINPGQTRTVESETFILRKEEGPKGRDFEGKVEGVGVRVLDAQGTLMADLYDPPANRKALEEAFSGEVKKRRED